MSEDRRAIAREVAQFNELIPIGTPVLYWPALREGPGVASETRTRAWLLGDHTPVVMVEGYAGGIALSHVCPIPSGSDALRAELAEALTADLNERPQRCGHSSDPMCCPYENFPTLAAFFRSTETPPVPDAFDPWDTSVTPPAGTEAGS